MEVELGGKASRHLHPYKKKSPRSKHDFYECVTSYFSVNFLTLWDSVWTKVLNP